MEIKNEMFYSNIETLLLLNLLLICSKEEMAEVQNFIFKGHILKYNKIKI